MYYRIIIVISKNHQYQFNKGSFIKKLYVLLDQYLLEVFGLKVHILAAALHFPIELSLEHFIVNVI